MRSLVAVVIVMWAGVARAGGPIALEAYTGERPADASRLLSPILDELATRGYAAGDTLARTYETAVSRPALSATGLPPDFTAQAERGFKLWVAGKFDDALKLLGPLVKTARENPGAFAQDPSLRDPLQKAMIAIALSKQRTGDLDGMRATFGEIVRSFPGAQLAKATYGPEAFEAFEQVRRETAASGTGKLVVKVTDDTGVVFIDETYRAVGTTTATLPPGEYRVCVMLNKQPSRSHNVVVRADGETTVTIDPKLDLAVHTTGWTGLAFATDADRDAHEGVYGAQVANAIGATAVAVVGIDQVRGRPSVVGSLVSLQNGHEIRRASIALDPDPSTDRLKAIARFLAGDPPAAGLEVHFGTQADIASKPAPGGDVHAAAVPHGGRWGGWRWITSGIAVGALATGTVLLALDGSCKRTAPTSGLCIDYYENSPGQWIALGAGAVFAGIAVYLFATQSSSTHGAYVAPTPSGATAGFATSF